MPRRRRTLASGRRSSLTRRPRRPSRRAAGGAALLRSPAGTQPGRQQHLHAVRCSLPVQTGRCWRSTQLCQGDRAVALPRGGCVPLAASRAGRPRPRMLLAHAACAQACAASTATHAVLPAAPRPLTHRPPQTSSSAASAGSARRRTTRCRWDTPNQTRGFASPSYICAVTAWLSLCARACVGGPRRRGGRARLLPWRLAAAVASKAAPSD